jgi:hypothetical protein
MLGVTITSATGKPSQITVYGISVQLTKLKNADKTITGNIQEDREIDLPGLFVSGPFRHFISIRRPTARHRRS